ncbi:unnamed protein product, partial [Dovyalis caffra]
MKPKLNQRRLINIDQYVAVAEEPAGGETQQDPLTSRGLPHSSEVSKLGLNK